MTPLEIILSVCLAFAVGWILKLRRDLNVWKVYARKLRSRLNGAEFSMGVMVIPASLFAFQMFRRWRERLRGS